MVTRLLVTLCLVALVAVPLAMAFDGCDSGSCAPACSVVAMVPPTGSTEPVLAPLGELATPGLLRFTSTAPMAPDAPPKSLPT